MIARARSRLLARAAGREPEADRRPVDGAAWSSRADLLAVAVAAALVVTAAVQGRRLIDAGVDLLLPFPPLLAAWLPHVGPGTPAAAVIAVAVVAWGPGLAGRLAWGPLLVLSWAAATGWTAALALVDGWRRGVAERLTVGTEYLHDVPRARALPDWLRVFGDHILTPQVEPGQVWAWTTHVGAHPPAAFGTFVLLDRIGLGGGGAAGVVVVLVGASAGAAVATAARALGDEDLARAALPFTVLFPGAVWVGVSADGMFAAVLAWGVALLAVGVTADRALPALGGGVLLGTALYLSYGLVLGGLLVVPLLLTRRWRALLAATAGAAAVVGAFEAAGFDWLAGYADVRVIYAASIAATRPYAYFVWANLAAFAIATGPAAVAGIRRLAAGPRSRPELLVVAALAAVVLADVSGLSKAEVERIWLPFGVWTALACARLPHAQRWLAAQAGLALAVNHLLFTYW